MKMKQIKYFLSSLILLAFASGCTLEKYEDLSSLASIAPPSGIVAIFDITNDNTGKVTITPSGEGVGSFAIYYGDGAATPGTVQSGKNISHNYAEGSYTVKIVGVGINGITSEKTYPLSIVYRAPENLAVTFTQYSLNLKVKATALYAKSFLVYFGDVANEVGTPLAIGAEVQHDYLTIGTYDVKVIALSGGAARIEQITPVTLTVPFVFPIDFENPNVNYFFGTFGGGQQFAKEANPNPSGINTSATVGRFRRGWESWSGTYSPLNGPLDFAVGKIVKVWVYTPDAINIGKTLNVELEAATGGSPANGVAVLKVPLTTSGEWEELVFDFSTFTAIPSTAKFNQLVLRFNDAVNGDFATVYVDNFRFTN
jgi:hypothetical protein